MRKAPKATLSSLAHVERMREWFNLKLWDKLPPRSESLHPQPMEEERQIDSSQTLAVSSLHLPHPIQLKEATIAKTLTTTQGV